MAFQFKQFKVEDNRSTMKVGTDAVLLGAWINVRDAKNILEIGSGSGVIALMLAQRSNATVDAIDIDEESVHQSNENFKNSPWPDKLNAFHISLNEFRRQAIKKYDLIVSNPPFFINSLKSPDKNKSLSKHTDNLSYKELSQGIRKLLSPDGRACLVLPYTESKIFQQLAASENLYLNKQLLIKPKADKNVNRLLMEFSFTLSEIKSSELYLRENNNSFSAEYKELYKDFYLNL